jgi:hypothetical protein
MPRSGRCVGGHHEDLARLDLWPPLDHLAAEPTERRELGLEPEACAEQGVHALFAQLDGRVLLRVLARQQHPRGRRRLAEGHAARARPLGLELRQLGVERPERPAHGLGERLGHAGRIDAALEPVARLGVQPMPAARAPHASRGEVGALEEHARRRVDDLAALPAHHARERERPLGVGDHEVVWHQAAHHAVEGGERLALARRAHLDEPPAHLVEVEGVHGLREEQHREVGHVDEHRDGAHAQRLQPVPRRERARAARRVLDHGRGVARTARGVGDGDRDLGRDARRDTRGPLARRGQPEVLARRRAEGQARERGQLAREPHVAEPVWAVGGEADLEDGVEHARHGVAQRRAGARRARQQHHDAFVVLAVEREPELSLGAQHARREHAADLLGLEGEAHGRQVRAHGREAHQPAWRRHVGRAAHDGLFGRALAAAQGHEAQLGARGGEARSSPPRRRPALGCPRRRAGCPRPRARPA